MTGLRAVRRIGRGTGFVVTVARVRTVRAVGLGGRRVPRGLDDLVRRRCALLVLLQRHDELGDLDEHADQGQGDALESEHVPDGRHHGADYHFDVAETHVHGFHLVLALLASGCNTSKWGYYKYFARALLRSDEEEEGENVKR